MDESNPWPTFVDAFSTVLCIFIFLMLVFVLNSMLIMYESSKKNYESVEHTPSYNAIAATDTTASQAREMPQSAEPTPQQVPSSSTSQAQAEQASVAEKAEVTEEQKQKQVVALADNNPTVAQIQQSGRFDSSKEQSSFEIKGNQFIVHFKSTEQGYPSDVIDALNKWMKTGKTESITVYAFTTPQIAVSDAMRLAYERGIILLKVVKGNAPGNDISISVVDNSAVMNNSAVITKVE